MIFKTASTEYYGFSKTLYCFIILLSTKPIKKTKPNNERVTLLHSLQYGMLSDELFYLLEIHLAAWQGILLCHYGFELIIQPRSIIIPDRALSWSVFVS